MTGFAVPPPEISARAGGELRFAVGTEHGLRSATWKLKGSPKTRDLYFGSRLNMNELKLSLHQSGDWRLAYTRESWEKSGGKGSRLLAQFAPPSCMIGNWRRAVSIIVPTTNLRPSELREPERRSKDISWWSPAPDGSAIWFEIMISDEAPDSTVAFGGIGIVGRLDLPDGSGVLVVADEHGSADQQKFEGSLSHPGWTWYSSNDDGHPLVLDTGYSTTKLAPSPDSEQKTKK
jgi:hypothetical protein